MSWLVVVLVGLFGLISAPLCLWLILRFLKHVYDRGGADDLRIAAAALRTARSPRAPLPEEAADASVAEGQQGTAA